MQNGIVKADDPERQGFATHCLTIPRNCRNEIKIVDLCQELIFQDGLSEIDLRGVI